MTSLLAAIFDLDNHEDNNDDQERCMDVVFVDHFISKMCNKMLCGCIAATLSAFRGNNFVVECGSAIGSSIESNGVYEKERRSYITLYYRRGS